LKLRLKEKGNFHPQIITFFVIIEASGPVMVRLQINKGWGGGSESMYSGGGEGGPNALPACLG